MTGELEQEFFKVFGIEPKWKDKRVKSIKTYYTEEQAQYLRKTTKNRNIQLCYPDITSEKLLVLLCIVIDEYNRNGRTFYLDSTNVKELKEEILDALMGCIDVTCDLFEPEVKQIQQLFKEEE